MRYPGYLLNPGDMFQVEPSRVLFATGALKDGKKAVAKSTEEGDESADTEAAVPEEEPVEEEEEEDVNIDRDSKDLLKDLLSQSKSILAHERKQIGAKKKQDLRAFTKAVKRMLGRSANNTILTNSLEAQFQELKHQLKIHKQLRKGGTAQSSSPDAALAEAQNEEEASGEDLDSSANYVSEQDLQQLQLAFQSSTENPIDPSKPYATPWRPREYMSAFAFIPRYLEVNQNICAAVYLRHPVVRPGLAEVPTPFGVDTNGSAFTWYLRRR